MTNEQLSYTSPIQFLSKAHHHLQYLTILQCYLATYWYLTTPSRLLSWGLLNVVAQGTAGVELEAVD